MAWLNRPAHWPGARLALWGGPGSGKTHLAHIWATEAGAALLPGHRVNGGWPAEPVAIDDADLAPEQDLLHILNAAAEAGHAVLLTGRTAPGRWPTRLPDLRSRLRATTAVPLGLPDDGFLRTLLAHLLAERQLVVPDALQAWLLLVLPRDPGSLREAAARLDRAAMAAGRRVTRALAEGALRPLLDDNVAVDGPLPSPPHPALF